ncbi:hypothetical protein ACQ4PT_070563 [Festuca glaucescens]
MGSPAAEAVVFRSRLPDIEIPNDQTLQSYCFAKMGEVGSRPCLINGETGSTYTYTEVEAMSRRAATGLRRMGVGRGDVIMNLVGNRLEFVISFLAAARLGAATTSAAMFSTHREIRRQAAATGVKLIVTDSCVVDKVRELAEEMRLTVVTINGKFDGCVEFQELIGGDEMEADAEIHPADVVALPYSSEVTGPAKGVMLTHRSIITSVALLVDGENPNLYLSKEDVVLCHLPMWNMYSFNSLLLPGLRAGSAIVVARDNEDEFGMFIDQVRKHRITVVRLTPSTVAKMATSPRVTAEDLALIRIVISDVSSIGKELQDAFMAKTPNAVLGQRYGSAETGYVVAMSLAFAKEPLKVKSGSCGTVVRNTELKIVDPDTGASLARNQTGEICIRGEQIMKGYVNDSEATKNTIDRDDWLHTRDIGFVDDDEEIFVVDRMKGTIMRKGFFWHCGKVEYLLREHPEIQEAAFMMALDDLAGSVPVACVVLVEGSKITEDEIKNFVGKKTRHELEFLKANFPGQVVVVAAWLVPLVLL